jgi:hypothetical protein
MTWVRITEVSLYLDRALMVFINLPEEKRDLLWLSSQHFPSYSENRRFDVEPEIGHPLWYFYCSPQFPQADTEVLP